MRIRINFTKELIIFLLFLLAGLYFFVYGLTSIYKEKNALKINSLDEYNCTKGEYVSGNISSYLVKNISNSGSGYTSGVSLVLIHGLKEYHFYTISMNDNKYIRVMISDENMLKQFEGILENDMKSVYFEGELVKSPVEIAYGWYENIDGFKVENIVNDYVINEVNYDKRKEYVFIGLALFLCSFMQFLMLRKKQTVFESEKIDKKEKRQSYYRSYDTKNELIYEKRRLKSLDKKKNELKKSCLYRTLFLAIGIIMILNNYYWGFIGLILCLLSLKGIIKYILNSGYKSTEWFMHVWGKQTINDKINECQKNILTLEKEET